MPLEISLNIFREYVIFSLVTLEKKKKLNFFLFSCSQVVAIFFAVKLPKAELPDWMDWILVAFVAFHGLMHFMLSVSSLPACLDGL